MNKKKIGLIGSIGAVLCAAAVVAGCIGHAKSHTFTLSGNDITKSERIQPVNGKVKVSGDTDTDVVFTDVESGEEHKLGYITRGMPGTIRLEKGKWYTVKGLGKLTVKLVNVRVE